MSQALALALSSVLAQLYLHPQACANRHCIAPSIESPLTMSEGREKSTELTEFFSQESW